MEIYCLDAEFTDSEELLELSVYNLEGTEIYHRYYKPVNVTEWRTDIHHITPEMVAEEQAFSECLDEVKEILDSSFALTGFAVSNDLRILSRSGITGLDTKRVIDVRDMYWYLKGREEEMSPFSVPSLIICANSLGLEFGEDEAHSATADTEATLRCFNLLFNEFKGNEGDAKSEEDLVDLFGEKIEDAKADFVEVSAKGFVKVYKQGDYYKIKYNRIHEEENKGLVAEIEVDDRYKAEYEIKKLLKKKELPNRNGVYKLTAKLLEDIKNYRNTYDAEESAWCKKVVRNLSRLTL